MTTPKYIPAPCPTCGGAGKKISGAWLRAQREKHGLTLREAARRLGISAAYLCDIEHDRRNCPEKLRVFCEVVQG